MKTWAEEIIAFYKELEPLPALPDSIQWLFPQKDRGVMAIVETFFRKYYTDNHSRTLLLGINPGRFGAGVTGVNFTAPRQLRESCGIDHPFKPQSELSAEFIYDVVNAYGGPQKFYHDFFIGSVCPLGFVQNGRNLNYYDDKALLKTVEPFIVRNLDKLMQLRVNHNLCICIGGEKNFRFLQALNEKNKWFDAIISLPHPRFIMQYRRKQKEIFVQQYLELLKK